jgi:hypothetical protein
MGLDWERLSLSGYLEAIVAHTSDGEGGKSEPEVSDRARLSRFHTAHKGGK